MVMVTLVEPLPKITTVESPVDGMLTMKLFSR
jgi:hypothetical protein